MYTLDDSDNLLAPDVEIEESVRGCSCGEADYGDPGHDGSEDAHDEIDTDNRDDLDDWESRSERQAAYDDAYPPMPDWMETELEARSRGFEGY